MLICNICEKKFPSGSLQNMEFFVHHVSECPLQVTSMFKERFHCLVCGWVVKTKKSFKAHLVGKHLNGQEAPEAELLKQCRTTDNARRQRRQIGK